MFKFMKAMFFSTHREKFDYWLDGMLNRSSEFRRFKTNVPPSIIRAAYNYAYQNYRPGKTPEETMLQMEKAVVDVVHFCMNYVQAQTDALRGNLNKKEREVFSHFVNEGARSIEFEKRRAELIAEWSEDPNWVRRNPEVARRFLGKDKHWLEAFGLPHGGNPCDRTIHDNVRDELIAKW
jgi:hypothetical protein